MVRVIRILAALLVIAPTIAAAQTLADVARVEEARRKTVEKPGKVYTNVDLQNDFTVPAAPAPGTDTTPGTISPSEPASKVPAPAAAAKADASSSGGKQDETFWKTRYAAAKDTLNRSRMFLDALQSRINALTTQIINRDDPYQQATLEQDRQTNLNELERVKRDIESQTKAIADIEDEARRAGVPPGWLR